MNTTNVLRGTPLPNLLDVSQSMVVLSVNLKSIS